METLIKVEKTEEKGILIFEFSGELDETNADKTIAKCTFQTVQIE